MKNKILKNIGTLVLGIGMGFSSYGQETIPGNLNLRDINGNYLGSMKMDFVIPLLMKFPTKPNGPIEFSWDNQGRIIEEIGYFYNNKEWDILEKIVTVKYEYINGKKELKEIIYDNNANGKIDEKDEIINYYPEL